MLIEPFSASNYGSGSKWSAENTTDATANFPGLKSFFRCNETSGTTLTDSIGGGVFTPTGASLTFITNGVSVGTNLVQALTSGAITNIGTDNFLFIALGRAASAASVIGFGDVTVGSTPCVGFYKSGVNWNSYVYDGTTAIDTSTAVAHDTTTTQAFAIKGVWTGGNLVVTNFVQNDSTTLTTPQASASTAMVSFAWDTSKYISAQNMSFLYSMLLYKPSTMPSNASIQSMLLWMLNKHVTSGVKYIYPALKGL